MLSGPDFTEKDLYREIEIADLREHKRIMKPFSSHSKEELDSIILDDYEGFGMDLREFPGFLEEVCALPYSIDHLKDIPRFNGLYTMDELKKWWILEHKDSVVKKEVTV